MPRRWGRVGTCALSHCAVTAVCCTLAVRRLLSAATLPALACMLNACVRLLQRDWSVSSRASTDNPQAGWPYTKFVQQHRDCWRQHGALHWYLPGVSQTAQSSVQSSESLNKAESLCNLCPAGLCLCTTAISNSVTQHSLPFIMTPLCVHTCRRKSPEVCSSQGPAVTHGPSLLRLL